MRCTQYFLRTRQRADRQWILEDWILRVVADPAHVAQQADRRWRLWRAIPEAGGRFLRVVLLKDRETVHNAFFDRDFLP